MQTTEKYENFLNFSGSSARRVDFSHTDKKALWSLILLTLICVWHNDDQNILKFKVWGEMQFAIISRVTIPFLSFSFLKCAVRLHYINNDLCLCLAGFEINFQKENFPILILSHYFFSFCHSNCQTFVKHRWQLFFISCEQKFYIAKPEWDGLLPLENKTF